MGRKESQGKRGRKKNREMVKDGRGKSKNNGKKA